MATGGARKFFKKDGYRKVLETIYFIIIIKKILKYVLKLLKIVFFSKFITF
jgi:hypothetical protein